MLNKEQIGEIRAAYRDAKNPQKQIGILADLYACKETEIRQVLGIEEAPGTPAPAAKKPAAKRAVKSYDQAVRDQLTKAVILGARAPQQPASGWACRRVPPPSGWPTPARSRRNSWAMIRKPKTRGGLQKVLHNIERRGLIRTTS